MRRSAFLALTVLAAVAAAGCATKRVEPDYARPLPSGETALRRVADEKQLPDLGIAWRSRGALLTRAIDASLEWFEAPSSERFFPFEGISHDQARASLLAMAELLERCKSEDEFVREVTRLFAIYESVGCDGRGTVLFTGYYAPVFRASRTRTGDFIHPLYMRPADLATDPVTGAPQGRRTPEGTIAPYPTREQIEHSAMLAGTELVWLDDALSAYLIHVNGSAKLRLTDGTTMYVGYAGKTDRPYASLSRAMIEEGLLDEDDVNLPAVRRAYRRNPARVQALMNRNENYVFFTEMTGKQWPSGSLGVPVTPEATLATDKRIYPRGGLVLVETEAMTLARGQRPFLRFMLDQDTGGAIQAPGRADIFMGVGRGAEILAGGQYAEGRLYYLFLKPQLVGQFMDRTREANAGGRDSGESALQRVHVPE